MTPLQKLMLAALLVLSALAARGADADDSIVVIGHPGLARMDAATVQRLYTGRLVSAGNVVVTAVNAAPGNPLRERFFAQVLAQDEDKYVAYWTVRRHVGKGTPPREFKSSAEIVAFVQGTPGALGYIGQSDLKPGMNVVFKP